MTSSEIRNQFIEFFKKQNHAHRPSASLVPDDPTVLFTVAGMVQFKAQFLGIGNKSFTRAVTAQKCVRTNDIENVGFTPRHHTFFEMLGNFSFGDYFKQEAITWAWEFLTTVCKLDKEKLWVTIYKDDSEAYEIWKNDVGLAEKRIVRMGEETNFWTMGATGPCGPCSEILYDIGPKPGKPEAGPDEDEDRYLEIWNLVFTQFDRQADGSLAPLPQKNIDTGMGLERLAAVMQGVSSNFDTDLFQPLIQAIAKETMKRYGKDEKNDSSMKVIADHIRSSVFLIADGVLPGNEGRGYVLRRILRRAVRHSKLLGLNDVFLYRLVPVIVGLMAAHYPEVKERREHVVSVVKSEEERFQHTLDSGLAILNDTIAEVKKTGKTIISGKQCFQLYDTYGFPLDLTREIAQEHKLGIDENSFNREMTAQRDRARSAWAGSGDRVISPAMSILTSKIVPTHFAGYTNLIVKGKVLALLQKEQAVKNVKAGDEVVVILDTTAFYAESGGQLADKGELSNHEMLAEISDVQKTPEGHFLHFAMMKRGSLAINESVQVAVKSGERTAIARNHTVTHLLHAALRQVLGKHIEQAGSEVRSQDLRFDFSHFQAVTVTELDRIEDIVNTKILENVQVDTQELSIEEAKSKGAMALFGEKYGDRVRMVQVDAYSKELCGGTHVRDTGEIGLMKIVTESSVAAGVRRIVAVTGENALREIKRQQNVVRDVCQTLHTSEEEVPARVEKLMVRVKELEKEKEKNMIKHASTSVDDLIHQATKIKGIACITAELPGFNMNAMRAAADALKQKIGSGVIVLGTAEDGKATLIAAVTKDLLDKKVHAGNLIREIAKVIEGSGGGRPDFAQAGGKNPEKLKAALAATPAVLEKMVTG
ncbi:alanine--tRNA ligase [bacterium]|nr:alanine--tRNA ligase [bacterium]